MNSEERTANHLSRDAPGTSVPESTPEAIHRYWFADALGDPSIATRRTAFWFSSSRETDAEIAGRFAAVLRQAGAGAHADWERQAHACLALIIVLDQFPRNIHRGTAAAFQLDEQTLGVARRGVAAGHLSELHTAERAFFLMPYQHVENLEAQREGVKLFERMTEEAPAEWRAFAEDILRYARLHLDIVERFGRFPHRNAILGRGSTRAEREYLEENTESFGQSAR